MDSGLREEFFGAMMRYKKVEAGFSSQCEMQMNELAILQSIAGRCACGDCNGVNLDMADIQKKLQISKPAVSYILNTLEKKDYIIREIDARDRRRIFISATPAGLAAAEQFGRNYDAMWEQMLTQFGTEDMTRLVELMTRLVQLFEGEQGQCDRKL